MLSYKNKQVEPMNVYLREVINRLATFWSTISYGAKYRLLEMTKILQFEVEIGETVTALILRPRLTSQQNYTDMIQKKNCDKLLVDMFCLCSGKASKMLLKIEYGRYIGDERKYLL